MTEQVLMIIKQNKDITEWIRKQIVAAKVIKNSLNQENQHRATALAMPSAKVDLV